MPVEFHSTIFTAMKSKFLFFIVVLAFATSVHAEPKLKSVFNGKDLSGWVVPKGNSEAGWYSAVDGVLKTGDIELENERGHWRIIEEEEYLSIHNIKSNKKYKFVLEEIE